MIRIWVRSVLFTLFFITPWSLIPASAAAESPVTLTAMTRNLYLGADLTPLFTAASPPTLVAAVTQIFASVQATNFPEGADALADEIATINPQLVGLQEATLWRSQTPADFSPTPNATHVEYDFLQILLNKLATRGKHFAAVASVINNDGEAPRDTPNGLQDIRLTDRDVLLARTDLPSRTFSVANAQSGHFPTLFSFPSPVLGIVTIPRGWVAVDATLRGRTTRVVNTHLESLNRAVQIAQGKELLRRPLHTGLPTVLLGDLNSAAGGVGAIPGESDTPTYANMLAAGFTDAWTEVHHGAPGFSCCQAADLRNRKSTLTERVDYVLSRRGLTASAAARTGNEPADRTPSGLWPSDHAGVWAVLQMNRDQTTSPSDLRK
jgi:endonuclease/exonuclease/phosphatase family metal-dependent hydrolase